ncbi:TIGR03086 family metal-binding protein [Streptomyces sp. H27-D2]|uniref:TIGR03086 family metal-binding protein n=1 Tax=Streptomyces sp. H27-D2 TaxID=3046304 RepID=UPI002DBA2A4B|nr:TIGR03086 family metal-binding protein [Streptomyces sp. H27-D2]MEC4019280.1 TIGR03086 family metal-binding protein [Streptomyces sp. H27-D2]
MSDTTWEILDQAHQALRTAVAGVPADGWQLSTPCEQWDVAQVLQHAAGDQLAYVAKLTGGPGPAYDAFAPSGTLDSSPAELLEPALARSAEAFAAVGPADQDVPVPLPPFKLPADLAVEAAALDAAVHAWDIAVATGQPSPLTPSMAQALRPVADALAEPLRGFAFVPAIEPAPDADALSSLLNHLGRRADWTAP